MQITWTTTLETDTPGDPDELQELAERVRIESETNALVTMSLVIGDYGSCETTMRVEL